MNIRDWRERHHLTQAELARLLGVAEMTVSRWEIGLRTPPAYLELALKELHRRPLVIRSAKL